MVTNPATRDWHRHRVPVRDAERDVRQPHRLRHRPRRLGGPRPERRARPPWPPCASRSRDPRAGQRRAASSTRGDRCASRGARAVALEVWVAAYGPKALELTGEVADGFILQLADPDDRRVDDRRRRRAAADAGRDPDVVKICVAAPAYVGRRTRPSRLAHLRDQCRWFGGMVGNHVADIVARTATTAACPKALTDYIAGGRATTTTSTAGPATPTPTSCRTRSSTGSASSARPRSTSPARGAQGARRRPVRGLPAARRQGRDARGLRRDRHPRGARPGHRQVLT